MDLQAITNQAVALAQELVTIPSESSSFTQTAPSSPELGITHVLQRLCAAANIPSRVQEALPGRYNFICRVPSDDVPKLLIAAHMDTVSAHGMEQPFEARIKNGKMYGRGACDDKGPLATAFATLLGLVQQNIALCYDVTFVGTVDEECSMSGASMFSKIADEYDLCIALEPTQLQVINAHKGVYRCEIVTHGSAAHSSSPELGDNAILTMHEIITDLRQYEKELQQQYDPELGRPTLAITQVNGGTVINIIPDRCSLSLDIRLLPNRGPKETAADLRTLIDKRANIHRIFAASAIHTPPDEDEIQNFLAVLRMNGLTEETTTAPYATDCSKLKEKGPCIVWGPGSIEQAHKQEEFIEISQIQQGCQVLAQFLSRKT